MLLIESGPRFYDNSTKSLKAIFPILFGLELESVDQAILALEQVLSGFIPIHSSLADDLDWLGRTLNDTLSKYVQFPSLLLFLYLFFNTTH